MTDSLPLSSRIRTTGLGARSATPFDIAPNAPERAALAAHLGITAVPEMRFVGTISPAGPHDLLLQGLLTARVIQPCVVTLDPVTTGLSERVTRRYAEDYTLPEGDEVEMPDDDGLEPLAQTIDLGAVATEALALALPLYPRSVGASLGEWVHAADGVTPLRDTDLRPFAALAELARKTASPTSAGGAAGTGDRSRDDGRADDDAKDPVRDDRGTGGGV